MRRHESRVSGSNRRPADYKSAALPTELTRRDARDVTGGVGGRLRDTRGSRPPRRSAKRDGPASGCWTSTSQRSRVETREALAFGAEHERRSAGRRDRDRTGCDRRVRRDRPTNTRPAPRGRSRPGCRRRARSGRYSIAPAAALATTGVMSRRPVPRQDEAGRARGLGRAHDRAEVAGIGDAVDGDEERAGRP